MQEDKSKFDFSGYLENKDKIGKMKDEMGGVLINTETYETLCKNVFCTQC